MKNPMPFPANLLVGTSSWSSSDWLGSFYPLNLKPGQFIEAYSRKFAAVEIDSIHYSIASLRRRRAGAKKLRRVLSSRRKSRPSPMRKCSRIASLK